MDLPLMLTIAAIVVGLGFVFGALAWPKRRPPSSSSASAPAPGRHRPEPADPVDDLADIIRSDLLYTKKKIEFGTRRYMEALVNHWAEKATGSRPPAADYRSLIESQGPGPNPPPSDGPPRPNR